MDNKNLANSSKKFVWYDFMTFKCTEKYGFSYKQLDAQ